MLFENEPTHMKEDERDTAYVDPEKWARAVERANQHMDPQESLWASQQCWMDGKRKRLPVDDISLNAPSIAPRAQESDQVTGNN